MSGSRAESKRISIEIAGQLSTINYELSTDFLVIGVCKKTVDSG
jgi:hypothetical protein